MATFRLLGRGFSDTLEHLLTFTLLTLGWWIGMILVIPAPAVTTALFSMTDPRKAVSRPEWPEAVACVGAHMRRGWIIAMIIVPPLIVLVLNTQVYAGTTSHWRWFLPFWVYLIVFGAIGSLYAFSVAALTDLGPLRSVRTGLVLVVVAPVRSVVTLLAIVAVSIVGALLVVPMVMFVPALIAAVVNRMVLAGLRLPVIDPLQPTPERQIEERRASTTSRFGP